MIPKLQQHKMFEVIQGTRPIQANSFRPLHRAPKHGNTAMFFLFFSDWSHGGENCGGFRDDLFDVFLWYTYIIIWLKHRTHIEQHGTYAMWADQAPERKHCQHCRTSKWMYYGNCLLRAFSCIQPRFGDSRIHIEPVGLQQGSTEKAKPQGLFFVNAVRFLPPIKTFKGTSYIQRFVGCYALSYAMLWHQCCQHWEIGWKKTYSSSIQKRRQQGIKTNHSLNNVESYRSYLSHCIPSKNQLQHVHGKLTSSVHGTQFFNHQDQHFCNMVLPSPIRSSSRKTICSPTNCHQTLTLSIVTCCVTKHLIAWCHAGIMNGYYPSLNQPPTQVHFQKMHKLHTHTHPVFMR